MEKWSFLAATNMHFSLFIQALVSTYWKRKWCWIFVVISSEFSSEIMRKTWLRLMETYHSQTCKISEAVSNRYTPIITMRWFDLIELTSSNFHRWIKWLISFLICAFLQLWRMTFAGLRPGRKPTYLGANRRIRGGAGGLRQKLLGRWVFWSRTGEHEQSVGVVRWKRGCLLVRVPVYYFHANVWATTQQTFECLHELSKVCVTWIE